MFGDKRSCSNCEYATVRSSLEPCNTCMQYTFDSPECKFIEKDGDKIENNV